MSDSGVQVCEREGTRHHVLLWCVAIGLLGLCCAAPAQTDTDSSGLRVGYTRSIFKNRNRNDVLAAMKVWAQTIAKERDLQVDIDMPIYESVRQAAAAVRAKEVDALVLLFAEHASFPADLLSGPYSLDEIRGRVHAEFVVLSRKNGGLAELKDLRGAKLRVFDGNHVELAVSWLDAQLVDAGLEPSATACERVEVSPKLSATVLGVFFGKSDACLITREGFETVAELNPQVSKQLRVVASSPPIIPILSCFRSDLAEADKNRLLDASLRLHETVAGEQVLRVFKADRMSPVTDEQVDDSVELLNGWRRTVLEHLKKEPDRQGSEE